MERIQDEILDKVVGGFFDFKPREQNLIYTHLSGDVTYHKILDYDKAWELSNKLHALNVDEDSILEELINNNYVQR